MSTQKAIVIPEEPQIGSLTSLAEVPIPEINSNQLLIKNVAIAINPTDWKHSLLKLGAPGSVIGSDGAGYVAKVGADVKGFKEGDIVSTFLHGGFYKNRGTFGEYIAADPQTTIKFDSASFKEDKVLKEGEQYPAAVIDSFEAAAAVPLGLVTSILSLVGNLNFSAADKGKFILIWSGATATGTIAIQLAKYLGLKVITTASAKNAELLKSFGADYVFDYRNADVVDQIKKVAGGEIKYALDAISNKESFQQLYDATYDSPEVKIDSLLFLGEKDITADDRKGTVTYVVPTLAYLVDGQVPLTVFGGTFDIEADTKKRYEDFWYNDIPKLIKTLKHHNLKVLPKGLASVEDAFNLLIQEKVSGEKIVFRI